MPSYGPYNTAQSVIGGHLPDGFMKQDLIKAKKIDFEIPPQRHVVA